MELGLANAIGTTAVNQEEQSPRFVFMLSVMPRSGTNFLAELLALHPDCARCFVDEDGLLAQSHNLARFAKQLTKVWSVDGNLEDLAAYDPIDQLYRSFGEGLKHFLLSVHRASGAPSATTLLSKTPRIKNIALFHKLFPDDRLIVLLRDGRAVTESYTRSFTPTFEASAREWAHSARQLREMRPQLAEERVLFVRYEDLVCDQQRTMDAVLAFLGLDPRAYDHAKAAALPVFGSSDLAAGGGKVDWKPRSKGADFNPLARAAGWSVRQKSRFDWLAGEELRALGYGLGEEPIPRFPIWNRWRDLVWSIKRLCKFLPLLKRLPRRARRILSA